jgi:hypothetical protein
MTNTKEKDSNEAERLSIEPQLSPMQRAIKARAIATIENQGNQPRLSVRRKLAFATLSIMTVVGLIFLINYGVAIMQRIFELWIQDDSPVVAPLKPGEPFYITVDPPSASAVGSASAQSSSD